MESHLHHQLAWRIAAAAPLVLATSCGRTSASAPAPAPAAAAAAPAASALPGHTAADIRFMTGMIGHHQQAVVMCGWADSHGASDAVRILCGRIVVAQQDEIAFMRRWLQERREPVPDTAHTMHGPLMPGMLTADELAELDRTRGPAYNEALLRAMIRHHQGAITMVEQLIDTPGAAQDAELFRFVSDVNADQTTEIERMTRLLDAMNSGRTNP